MQSVSLRFVVGVVGFLFACEVGLQILPVSTATATGYYIDPLILTYPSHHRWTVSTGWDLRNAHRLNSNNAGFVAHRDFFPNENAIALIGDSFVEASSIDASDRPGIQLENAMAGRHVYAMGGPGSALLDYAERIRYAHTHYRIHDFVVLMERGDVRQSLCGSGNIHGPCLDQSSHAAKTEKQPLPSFVKQVARHSALAQYIFGQLKFDPKMLLNQVFGNHQLAKVVAPKDTSSQLQVVDDVLRTFLKRIQVTDGIRIIFVLDSDRAALYEHRTIVDPARERFIDLARKAGAEVIDTEPLYRAHLATSSLKLDVGPFDGHLNPVGVKIVMRAAATALRH